MGKRNIIRTIFLVRGNKVKKSKRFWFREIKRPSLLRLAPVACVPTLDTNYTFSRAQHRLHIFPRSAPVTHFPALSTGYMFSRAWHPVPWCTLVPVAGFCALGNSCLFCCACLTPVTYTSLEFWLTHNNFYVFSDRPDAIKTLKPTSRPPPPFPPKMLFLCLPVIPPHECW